jgi:hypothetical protein
MPLSSRPGAPVMTFVSNVTLGQIQSALSVGRVKRPIGSTQYVRLVRNFFVDLILVVRLRISAMVAIL